MPLGERPSTETRILASKDSMQTVIRRMAGEIHKDYKDDPHAPTIVAVLEGAMEFAVDLGRELFVRGLDCPRTSVFSDTYGDGRVSKGEPELVASPKFVELVHGRRVLLLDDTEESGTTGLAVVDFCTKAGAVDVRVAVQTSKLDSSNANYVGLKFIEENKPWLEGRGLDTDEYGRSNLNLIERI